jgi:hypothetical protein
VFKTVRKSKDAVRHCDTDDLIIDEKISHTSLSHWVNAAVTMIDETV